MKNIQRFSTITRHLRKETIHRMLPKLLVFDLDGLVWDPEMYQLGWSAKGNDFSKKEDGNLLFRNRTEVYLIGHTRKVFQELYSDEKWKETTVCFASCCDVPAFARECIEKFRIYTEKEHGKDIFIKDLVPTTHRIIKKEHKGKMIKQLQRKFSVPDNSDVIFFDNQMNNIRDVRSMVPGSIAKYCPEGLERNYWDEALEEFQSNKGGK
eukprot:maker-scaffold_14-snap-gene-4.50-mRNA-1 protein AED:0.35 eAED:0.35 QI:83/1/1/1/0/0.33/3/81/208